ncbi:ABC transporter ATP-binding protein [Dermacoccaceae bacterium W4C1]
MSLLVLWQVAEAMVPVLIGVIIDRAIAPADGAQMVLWGAVLVVNFMVLSLGYRFGSRLGFGLIQTEGHRMRVEIAEHALHPQGARTDNLTGEVLSLATTDAEHVSLAGRSFGYTASSIAAVIFGSVVLLSTDWVIGLVVLIGLPLMLALIQVITPAIARRSRAQQGLIAAAAGTATDFVQGLRVLKGIGAERAASDRYRKRSQDARDAGIRTATSRGMLLGATEGVSGLFLAAVALLAGVRAASGELTVGELIAVVGLTQFLAEPMAMLGGVSAQFATAHASASRIVEFLHTPRMISAGTAQPAEDAPGGLQLHQISTEHLTGIDLAVQPGECLGVVVEDPSAAGDLMRLLAGEVQPDGGAVTIAGVAGETLSVAARRRWLTVVPHHNDLFEGSLRSNIDLTGTLAEDTVVDVVHASATDDIVALHPLGLDQPVTSGGRTFSGGQQQRIALARALAADAPILVLHDPTSAVDAVTEQRIATGLARLRAASPGRCTLVLTSSPALLAAADRVVMIREGRIVLAGSPDEVADAEVYREAVLR